MLNVCVPVLRRYDMLANLLLSLGDSTLRPDAIYIIDNGRNPLKLDEALRKSPIKEIFVEVPEANLGVAASWNFFLQNVSEERVIVNDDVTFGPDSLRLLVASKADLVWAKGEGFSCYVMRDSCVEKVGFFDETISPGYGYYEDDDYLQRLDGRGTKPALAVAEDVQCGLGHSRSSTLAAATAFETMDHHRRFKIAQHNYMTKWGLTSI